MPDDNDFIAAAKHRIYATFRKWDTDGNGQISLDELTQILMDIGMQEADCARIFQASDLNKDGVVSYSEFVCWMCGSASEDLPAGAERMLWEQDTLKQVLLAATTGDSEKAIALIQRDGVITADAADASGTTILMAAAKGGRLDLINRLLEMGCCKFNAVDNEGNTALDYAFANRRTDVIEYMTIGHFAYDNSVIPFVRALFPAVLRGDAQSISQSLRPCVTYTIFIDRHMGTYHGLSLLPVAHVELLVKDIDFGLVDEWNRRNSSMQVKPGDHIVQVNEACGDSRVLLAELGQYQEMTIVLQRFSLDQVFDANVCDERGTPLLHHAVRCRKADVLRVLIETAKGPNINAKDHHGRTALDSAVEQGRSEFVDILKQNGGKQSGELKVDSS